jgi:rhamnosyl/mannosyltransferase
MNKFLSSVDRIVSSSPNYFKSSKVLARFKDKVSVIPVGLEKSTYPALSKDRLEYWQKKFGDKFFLFVGVMRYYKGLHILIEAVRNSDYPIVVVGAGPIEKELKDQVESLGINNIYFVGFVSDEDKVALFTLSYAVLFPSHLRSEAFGISLLEGAMHGKPLISSEIGTGTTYINIDGETGMVVPPSDPGALRKAMDYLWNNPVVAKKMGKRAEKRYWDLFTADKMAKSYVDLYQSLLD